MIVNNSSGKRVSLPCLNRARGNNIAMPGKAKMRRRCAASRDAAPARRPAAAAPRDAGQPALDPQPAPGGGVHRRRRGAAQQSCSSRQSNAAAHTLSRGRRYARSPRTIPMSTHKQTCAHKNSAGAGAGAGETTQKQHTRAHVRARISRESGEGEEAGHLLLATFDGPHQQPLTNPR